MRKWTAQLPLWIVLISILSFGSPAMAQSNSQPVSNRLGLTLLKGEFAVCALDTRAAIPRWASDIVPVSITRSSAALSVIAAAAVVPRGTDCDKQWRAFEVERNAPSAVGVIAGFSQPLAAARISIHWISSSPADYMLVKEKDLERAIQVLVDAGHPVAR